MNFLNFLKSTNNNHKSIRVNTNIGDKFINVNLNQTYESMDILSLKVFQKDLYRLFDADYGIIVGRVIGNNGTGIPNCKISVFIPLDEELTTTPTTLDDIKKIQAASLYTYESVYDRDVNNKIYNLLPKYGKNRNFNGFPDNDYGIGATPKTPVGTFPEKEEILANDSLAYVYDKYLKYTTTTNESGDYILVVPSNRTFTVNMSCDITDIGKFSTTPALLKLQGYSDNFFKNNNTTINDDLPLESLPNVEIQNIPITVKPLWSQDSENTNVGINRLDFNLNKKIEPYTTVIGNYFTQNKSSWWGDKINFRATIGLRNLCVPIFGNCSPRGDNFIEFWFGIRARVCITAIPDFTIISTSYNIAGFNDGDFGNNCGFRLCLGFNVKYIIPFFNFLFFKKRFCTLRGGKTESEPFDFRWVLANACTRSTALQFLGGEITDSLFLEKHDRGNVDIKVFGIKNTVTDDQCNQLNNLPTENYTIATQYDSDRDIELLETNRYAKLIDDGNFIVLLPTNRKKVITNEEGNLIEVPFDSEKGVFTEFRGYFIITHLDEVNNPPTRNRTAKIRLKIPQFFDYRNNPINWIWKHYKFEYGEVYSVSQYNDVKNANFSQDDEGGDDDMFAPTKTRGWDEQTNILFVGVKNDTNNNIYYEPNNNPDTDYTSFYNHITYLGQDGVINNIDVTASADSIVQPVPENPDIYNFEISIEGDDINTPILHTFTVMRTFNDEDLNEPEFTDIIINNILIVNKPNPLNSSYSDFSYFLTDSNNDTILYEEDLTSPTVTGSLPNPIIIQKSQISITYPQQQFGIYFGEYDAKLGIINNISNKIKYLPIKIRVENG